MTHAAARLPLWVGVALVLSLLVLRFVVGALLAGVLGVDPEAFDGSPGAFVTLGVIAALEAAILVGTLRSLRLGLGAIGWQRFAARDLGLGALGFALCLVAMVMTLGPLIGGVGAAVADLTDAIAGYTPAQRVFFVGLGVVAAFSEETVFRGALQPALQDRLGRWTGILVGAIIFAAYHLQFHPVLLVGKMLLGLVYGGLRERTGTLWAPAIAHASIWIVVGAA